MQYLGGKSRIARRLAEVIQNEVSGRKVKDSPKDSRSDKNLLGGGVSCLVSLFCGSCAVESKLTIFERRICNDKQPYLIELLKGVQNGYELPEYISEEEYKRIRNDKDTDKVLTGFVGFGCSFGGKFFGGYARNKSGTNYALQSKKSLLKDMKTLNGAEFTCKDYRDVELPANCIIYADPPYDNTTGYGNEKFDSTAFWEYAREVSKEHLMFISEQSAPDDFVAIWEVPFRRTLDCNKDNQFIVTEKLFIHKSLL